MKKVAILFCLTLLYLAGYAQAPDINYTSPQTYTAGVAITPLVPINSGGAIPVTAPGETSTLAGNPTPGIINGEGSTARFNRPRGVAVDDSGNVYIADAGNNVIRKISPEGVVNSFAGDGIAGYRDTTIANLAEFNAPVDVAVDTSGNVYVADLWNNRIRKITPEGAVTTLAGNDTAGWHNGKGAEASFFEPRGLVVDDSGNVFVADAGNNTIRKITPEGLVTSIAGSGYFVSVDGTYLEASFAQPVSIALDNSHNLYVTDISSNMIRKITPGGKVTTIAGGEYDMDLRLKFSSPSGIDVDQSGNIYIADEDNNMIRKITPEGEVTILAGSAIEGSVDGIGKVARFSHPNDVALDASGNIYVADLNNNMIRKVRTCGYSINPSLPEGLIFDATTGIINGTPSTGNSRATYFITGINATGSSTTLLDITIIGPPTIITLAPSNIETSTAMAHGEIVNLGSPDPTQFGVVWSTNPNPTTALSTKTEMGGISTAGRFETQMIELSANTKYYVRTYATNSKGTSYGNEVTFYTKDFSPEISYASPQIYGAQQVITPLSPTNEGGNIPATIPGEMFTLAGGNQGFSDGTGSEAEFYRPMGIAADVSGNLYVADDDNNKIRKITPEGVVTTLAGSGIEGSLDGADSIACFYYPVGVAVDLYGNVYVADYGNNLIRKITSGGDVTTLAGSGLEDYKDGKRNEAGFSHPTSLAVDDSCNVYVTDYGNSRIRKISSDGEVTTMLENGKFDAIDETKNAAVFNDPFGLALDISGSLFVTDQLFHRIYKISPDGNISTFAGSGYIGSSDGTGSAASFFTPADIAIDISGNIFVADRNNNMIRKITADGVVTTIYKNRAANSNSDSLLSYPTGIATDALGNVYVTDILNNRIRKITPYGYSINPDLPSGLNFDGATGTISGTPTRGSKSTNYSITGSNAAGKNSTILNITVTQMPVVSTLTIANVKTTSATVNCRVSDLGVPNLIQYGIVWSTSPNPTVELSTRTELGETLVQGIFSSFMTDLTPNTMYYVSAYATNNVGTYYGNELSFATEQITDIDESVTSGYRIFPNPASEYLTIIQMNAKTDRVQVVDLSGKLMMDSRIVKDRIDIRNLKPGMYIMHIGNQNFKFVKE